MRSVSWLTFFMLVFPILTPEDTNRLKLSNYVYQIQNSQDNFENLRVGLEKLLSIDVENKMREK